MISIIIPFSNEKGNLERLFEEIKATVADEFEAVFVDDGSTDGSYEEVEKLRRNNAHIILVSHSKRFGKGQALQSGLAKARGEIIVFMDGDLQDDPKYIPHFIRKIQEGDDFVNGIRKNRKDNGLVKLYSGIVNIVLRRMMGSPFTDINCGFKAFKREVLNDIVLYGNNFRFLPLAAYYKGYKVSELAVENRPRIAGRSKFGISKLFIGIVDTVTAYFLFQFAEQPLHFFGAIGGFFFMAGFLISLYLTIERIFFNMLLYRRPALLLGILLIIIGIQIVMTGIIGELIVYLNKRK